MRFFRTISPRRAGGPQASRYGARAAEIKLRQLSVTVFLLLCNLVLAPLHPAAAEPVRVLALGDSLTAGYGLAAEDGFVAQLQRALDAEGLDVRVLDGGVPGDTTAGGLARLDKALADDPHAAILELGANDGLRGLDPAAIRANLDAILTRLGEAGIPVLLAGMRAPPNLGPEYGDEFNRIYPELAETHGVALDPFFLDGVAADPALNQADGIHPNTAGVRVIVERMMPALRRLIEQARAGAAG